MRTALLARRAGRGQKVNIAVDLHMHSCLSPCGDELMTPNNIVNMAIIKGLDAIAVCDHNTARQLPAVEQVALESGLTLLPGIEITTAEEIHLLAYFGSVGEALEFSDYIYEHLPPIPNRPEYFGVQQLMDSEDEPTGTEDRLLLTALDLSLSDLTRDINAAGGLAVPAHINRGSNGLLIGLGMLPADEKFAALELSSASPAPACDLGAYKLLFSSDAHYLENMAEREYFLNVPERSREGLFGYLKSCRARVWGDNFC